MTGNSVLALARRASLALLVSVAVPSAVHAQEPPAALEPLAEAMEESASSYPLVRCSALFASLAQWAGAEGLGEDLFDTYFETATNLAYVAAAVLVEEAGFAVETAGPVVDRDLGNIADLYLARFEQNYAATGEAFGQDALVQGDLALCIQITQFVLEGSA